jgi:hypothetical protein
VLLINHYTILPSLYLYSSLLCSLPGPLAVPEQNGGERGGREANQKARGKEDGNHEKFLVQEVWDRPAGNPGRTC